MPLLLLLVGLGSLAAYGYLSNSGKAGKHGHGAGASHAERQPLVPHEHGEEEE
jgi:hypothetical protein